MTYFSIKLLNVPSHTRVSQPQHHCHLGHPGHCGFGAASLNPAPMMPGALLVLTTTDVPDSVPQGRISSPPPAPKTAQGGPLNPKARVLYPHVRLPPVVPPEPTTVAITTAQHRKRLDTRDASSYCSARRRASHGRPLALCAGGRARTPRGRALLPLRGSGRVPLLPRTVSTARTRPDHLWSFRRGDGRFLAGNAWNDCRFKKSGQLL